MSNTTLRASKACWYGLATVLVCLVAMLAIGFSLVPAGEGTEFPGTVLMVDHTTGKFTVKKDGGGTRFTFVANAKTKFGGSGVASLQDLKKDDHVVVVYQAQGSQYLAASVTKK